MPDLPPGFITEDDPDVLSQLNQRGGPPSGYVSADPTTSKFLSQIPGTPSIVPSINQIENWMTFGLANPAKAAGAAVGAILPGSANPGSFGETYTKELRNLQQGTEGYAQAHPIANIAGSVLGGMAGAPMAGVPSLVPGIAAGTAIGAASGAAGAPSEIDPAAYTKGVLHDAIIGGVVGGGLPIAGTAVARAINPQGSARLAPLLQAGVTPTMGQAAGGAINRLEQAAMSVPLLGDFVKSARARVGDQFYRGAINEALSPIGESLDASTPSGREAFQEARGKISDAYNRLLPNVTATLDPQFAQEVGNLRQLSQFMPADRAAQFDKLLQGQVLNKFNPQTGNMTGETFKEIEEALGRETRSYLGPQAGPDERKYGAAVQELQSQMRQLLQRSNPDQAQSLASNNIAWANMLRVQRASAYTGAEDGVFSPAQLQRAVRSQTPESVFAQGKGLMQPYAEAGKSVLGSTVPDSGTPFRSLATILGASALGHGMSPELAAGAAAAGAGTAGLYSPPMQWLITHGMAARPQIAAPIGDIMRRASPYGGAAFGSMAP